MVGHKTDGKPDRRVVYAKTQAEVLRKLNALKERRAGGTLASAPAERETINSFLRSWLDATKSAVRPQTWAWYERMARVHLVPALGRHRLASLRPDVLQQLYSQKLDAGLAPQTVVHIHRVLHRALSQAVQWGYVARNVAEGARPPSAPRQEILPPSPPELARLLDTAREAEDQLWPLWTVAAYSGCRQSELLGLTWSHVDLDGDAITISRSLAGVVEAVPEFGQPKTARSRRTITLPPEAMKALHRQRVRRAKDKLALGPDYADYDLVFATRIGNTAAAPQCEPSVQGSH